MKRILLLVPATFLIAALNADPAHAQAPRTWVSGGGDDANPCSFTAPCKTFAGAISKTLAGGEINCIDGGGFGALTITKSLAIQCEYTEAGVLAGGTNGITVNAPAGSIVTLRGLDIVGAGTGLSGVNFIQAGVLHVEKCIIRGFNAGTVLSPLSIYNPFGVTIDRLQYRNTRQLRNFNQDVDSFRFAGGFNRQRPRFVCWELCDIRAEQLLDLLATTGINGRRLKF